MPRLSDSAAAALGVAPGVEHDAGFIDYKAEEIAKGVAWLLRDAAKKRIIGACGLTSNSHCGLGW